jgi:hypothetical protein
MTTLPSSTQAYVYSIVRAMPNPRRGECVNLGVILLAPDGHYSDARFGSLNRVRKLDSNADTDSIRSFLNGVMGALPLHGYQTHLATRKAPLDVSTLNLWSKEFGGGESFRPTRPTLSGLCWGLQCNSDWPYTPRRANAYSRSVADLP